MYLTSAGDAFAAAALLGVAAGPWAGIAAALAAGAAVARWGTPDLAAIAGDQDVLGPAVATGPVLGAASSACAAIALLVIAGHGRASREAGPERFVIAFAAGLGAAVLACGPAPTSIADVGARAGAAIVAVGLALLGRWGRLPVWSGAAAGGVAVVSAVLL